MDVGEMIKEVSIKNGMDMCGIASMDRFAGSPQGRHPTEILPGCKSVIVVGVRLLDGIVQANFRTFEDGREDLKGLYGTYGYVLLPNFALTYACYAVAQFIERNFHEVAAPLSTGAMQNGKQISIKHAAVAAGLGEFGWMSMVLTPEFGPRCRFGVVLTTAEIEPDPMYNEQQLCDPEACSICTTCCPTNAIGLYGSDNQLSCTVGDKTCTYAKVGLRQCKIPAEGLRKEFGGKEDWVPEYNVTDKDVEEAYARMPLNTGFQGGIQRVATWHCAKCMSYCPAGKWKEKFLDRKLSGGLENDKWGNKRMVDDSELVLYKI